MFTDSTYSPDSISHGEKQHNLLSICSAYSMIKKDRKINEISSKNNIFITSLIIELFKINSKGRTKI